MKGDFCKLKFEKLNEDKIRIVLDMKDLEEKNIDFHSFVSQSIESQQLFLDMLDEAEEKIGFITKDYKLMIEALALAGGDFILTVTRIEKELDRIKLKKVKIKRKTPRLDINPLIYSFSTFEDFCSFCTFFSNNHMQNYNKLIKKDSLYVHNSTYYLVLTSILTEQNQKNSLYFSITEFAEYIKNPEIFERKLKEYGKLLIPNKAIKTCIEHFV